jgi:hypothetical protein
VGRLLRFSGRDPHRMMHMYGLCKGPVCLAEGASERGRVSIDATCCEHCPEGLRRLSGVPHLVVLDGYTVACIISATAAGPGSRAAPA